MSCCDEFKRTKTKENAVECLRCLKEHYEEIYFDDQQHRLKLAREVWDKNVTSMMQEISIILNVMTREAYVELKDKYNLTIY